MSPPLSVHNTSSEHTCPKARNNFCSKLLSFCDSHCTPPRLVVSMASVGHRHFSSHAYHTILIINTWFFVAKIKYCLVSIYFLLWNGFSRFHSSCFGVNDPNKGQVLALTASPHGREHRRLMPAQAMKKDLTTRRWVCIKRLACIHVHGMLLPSLFFSPVFPPRTHLHIKLFVFLLYI